MKKTLLTLIIFVVSSLLPFGFAQNSSNIDIIQGFFDSYVEKHGVEYSILKFTQVKEKVDTLLTNSTLGQEAMTLFDILVVLTSTLDKLTSTTTLKIGLETNLEQRDAMYYMHDVYKGFDEPIRVSVYDLNDYESDLLATVADPSQDLYDNVIQRDSKDKDFDTSAYPRFFNALIDGKYASAGSLLVQNNTSPFRPTCCAFQNYIGASPDRSGITGVFAGGNGDTSLFFFHMIVVDDLLYQISMMTDMWDYQTYIDLAGAESDSVPTIQEAFTTLFHTPGMSAEFDGYRDDFDEFLTEVYQ